jgi:crotonobetainyl-CoA:carnitine CoA-transferase CaiB-like acyl-CoA transferase
MYELLRGVKIVDLTTTYLGPYATMQLGDLGADVVKVESLDGDVGRSPGPGRHGDMGAGFLNTNRNKRSLAIDLKTQEGREAVTRIVRGADALVHNMRPKAAAKLGFGYEEMKRVNTALVYCFAPGFGQDGPYADQPAYDDIIQAMTGFAGLNKDTNGNPRFLPSIVADKVMGLHLALALASGLVRRLRTGQGCAIEVPMFESMTAFLLLEHLAGRSFSPPESEAGYARLLAPNRRPYRTKDGFVAIMPYTSQQWFRFIECIGRSELLEEDWVKEPVLRSRNSDRLYQLIADAGPSKTTAEWLTLMRELDIPSGPVNGLADLFSEPHLSAVHLFEEYQHPSEGALMRVRSPFRVTGLDRKPDRPAPDLGGSAEAILVEAGYSALEVKKLRAKGIIKLPD